MKLRGPGSSGNAELAAWSSQHSRKKEGGAAVVMATQLQTLEIKDKDRKGSEWLLNEAEQRDAQTYTDRERSTHSITD